MPRISSLKSDPDANVLEDIEFERPWKINEKHIQSAIVECYSGVGFYFLPDISSDFNYFFNSSTALIAVNATCSDKLVQITSFGLKGLRF